jgi:hypothetical protein
VELSHRDIDVLDKGSAALAARLAEFPNVKDIDDGYTPGKQQLNFELELEGRSLGLSSQEVARQIRTAFYGAQAVRQQRGRKLRLMKGFGDQPSGIIRGSLKKGVKGLWVDMVWDSANDRMLARGSQTTSDPIGKLFFRYAPLGELQKCQVLLFLRSDHVIVVQD